MDNFTNPFVWMLRFRHRRGYGVHSPFAYEFLTNVVYEKGEFYQYSTLDRELALKQRFRIRQCLHLMFRLSNHLQPGTAFVDEPTGQAARYVMAGCHKCRLTDKPDDDELDLCLLASPNDQAACRIREGGVLVVDNLRQHHAWFASLPAVLTFDLWDMGIAFFDSRYNKQHYIVNFT